MNPVIINQERLVKPKEVPEFLELTTFVSKLDDKYGICSKDRDNSFCCLNPDTALLSHLHESNVYYYLCGGGNVEHLPKYMHVTVPFGKLLRAGTGSNAEPLKMDTEDQKELFRLRQQAIIALKKIYPKRPVFKETDNSLLDYAKRLQEQGFAVELFHAEFRVENQAFQVEYRRLDGNKAPYFSTAYKGWQNQDEMPHNGLAYLFYKKWNPFHLIEMTEAEYREMKADLKQLYKIYPNRCSALYTWRKPGLQP